MGKALVHFGEVWKGKIEAGYWPRISRGVQEVDGAHVIDFYGRRYELKPTRGHKGEFDVVKDIGAAIRQPRGGRGPRKPADAAPASAAAEGTPEAPKGHQQRRATPKRPSTGRTRRARSDRQPQTGGTAKPGGGTATDNNAAGRGSRRTARKQPAAA